MLNILIDKLIIILDKWLFNLNMNIVIQVVILFAWIVMLRAFHLSYRFFLIIALILTVFSMTVSIFNMGFAGIIGEYAFLFLGIGIVQMLLLKDN